MGNCYVNRNVIANPSTNFASNKQFEAVGKVRSHDLHAVKHLLDEGFPVNFPLSKFNDRTLLHIAAQNGAISICEMLLKQEANVNAEDIGGLTPVFVAMQSYQREVILLLYKHKADFNHTTRYNTRLDHYLPRFPPEEQRKVMNLLKKCGFLETIDNFEEVF